VKEYVHEDPWVKKLDACMEQRGDDVGKNVEKFMADQEQAIAEICDKILGRQHTPQVSVEKYLDRLHQEYEEKEAHEGVRYYESPCSMLALEYGHERSREVANVLEVESKEAPNAKSKRRKKKREQLKKRKGATTTESSVNKNTASRGGTTRGGKWCEVCAVQVSKNQLATHPQGRFF